MRRALMTLAAGVLAALLAAVLLTGGAGLPRGFAWVVLTIGAGTAVMAVVARRARQRERLRRLDERRRPHGQHLPAGRGRHGQDQR